MSTPSDDAQRKLEQRALRNVRALVDKFEDQDATDARSTRRMVVVIVAAILAVVAIAYAAIRLGAKDEPAQTYVLPPPANTAK